MQRHPPRRRSPSRVASGIALVVAIASCLASSAAAQEKRFVAAFADGQRVSADEIQAWHFSTAQPKIGDRLLFDPEKPVVWIRDNAASPAVAPPAFVEFWNGDLLPGRVIGARTGAENRYETLPPHLLVETNLAYDWPEFPRKEIKVQLRWVKRLTWDHRRRRNWEPGIAFFADGRRQPFRAARLQDDRVRFLLDDGAAEAQFSELAEIHFPRPAAFSGPSAAVAETSGPNGSHLALAADDFWDAWFEQLAVLSPDLDARLVTIEASDGLLATTSTARYTASSHGSHDPSRWFHVVQPAWCLEPLWLRHRSIILRRYHEPDAMPLTRYPAASADRFRNQDGHWPWRFDRNIREQPLRSGGESYGWGVATHAPCRLRAPAPPWVRAMRAKTALDETAGRGGCARAVLLLEGRDAPLYASPPLVGSQTVEDMGEVALPEHDGSSPRQLLLVSDPLTTGGPPGADPLNIRDFVNWLEPELLLDREQLQTQVRQAARRIVPAWQEWTLEPGEGDLVSAADRWDALLPRQPQWRSQIRALAPLYTLSRTLRLRPQDRFLAVGVTRFAEGTSPARVQVRLDGRPLGEYDVPSRHNAMDPDPILASLPGMAGSARLEIAVLPMGPQALLDWRSIDLASSPPGLRRIFEDEPATAAHFEQGEGLLIYSSEDSYAGEGSLSLKGARRAASRLPGLPARIREIPRLGEFRYLRFAVKTSGPQLALELEHNGAFGPQTLGQPAARDAFRYDLGPGQPVAGAAIRVYGQPPAQWIEITRDLYGDFGAFELTGLALASPTSEGGSLDYVYLGRTPKDFEKIEAARRP